MARIYGKGDLAADQKLVLKDYTDRWR